MSIAFIRCSEKREIEKSLQPGIRREEKDPGLLENAGIALVYAIGVTMVILQMRSLL